MIDDLCPLLPEEEQAVRSAVFKRRLEFSTGRWCAHEALTQLGAPPEPILMGSLREPVWPAGFIGTITHTDHVSAAVGMRTGLWRGIGIDILDLSRAEEILREASGFIASEDEEDRARKITGTRIDARVLLFSTKESVIKAISSSYRRFVDFTEIFVELEENNFRASCPGFVRPLRGWWKTADDLLVTGATLQV
jgi:4'-phosphopantetheinyl transferase EntD